MNDREPKIDDNLEPTNQEKQQLNFSSDDDDFLIGDEIQHVELQDLRGTGILHNRIYHVEDCKGLLCTFLTVGLILLVVIFIVAVSTAFALANKD